LSVLLGPNGAGKTTIAKMILGIEKPTYGTIKISQKITLGYVPQKLNFTASLPLTAKEFLSLLIKDKIYQPNEMQKKILDFSNFESIKERDIKELSGGQLQKLVIGVALLKFADLIIFDEPTKSLDANSQQEFYHLLNYVKENTNLTIFMISHDLFTVMKNADQVICLNKHICCSGCPKNLSHNPDLVNHLSEIGLYTHQHDHNHN
jgi:zinc transport system ATP-binding protein